MPVVTSRLGVAFSGAALAAGWLAFGSAAAATDSPSVADTLNAASELSFQDVIGWHVVEDGETLESITESYLGTKDLWYANWRLNPQVVDPHWIYPGQRLRVITERQVPARRALLEAVANNVDKNPRRAGWQDAISGDELEAPSGIRTGSSSSALVNFDQGTRVTLTERTQVFLKEMSTGVTGQRRSEIEVERGQADLVITTQAKADADIEILVGETVVRPEVGAAGGAETRARRAESGGSQLMVFGGTSQVEAGGVSVAVPQGMGTSVPAGGTPSPPERLLPRVELLSPEAGSSWTYRNPSLRWRPVSGAASYTVELCRDAQCASLVERQEAIEATDWRPPSLPPGDFHWRVTAVAKSGLDGYPSRSARFEIAAPPSAFDHDRTPPTVAAVVVGAGGVEPSPDDSAAARQRILLGPGGRIRLLVHDDAAGVELVRYQWDGGTWKTWRGQDLTLPGTGSHQLRVKARDLTGRESTPWQITVVSATDAPAPPTVRGPDR